LGPAAGLFRGAGLPAGLDLAMDSEAVGDPAQHP